MTFSQSTNLLLFSLETLTFIIMTCLSVLVELIDLAKYVIIFQSQTTLLTWLIFLLGSSTVIVTVLHFWISFFCICYTMAFPQLGNSDQVVVSVSIDFPSNSQRDAPFHRMAYDYSRADWGGLRDHLRDVPWEDILKLDTSAAASEWVSFVSRFRLELMYVPLIENIRSSLIHLHGFQLLVLLP